MIVRMKQIYEEVSRENGWPQSMVESIGLDVFTSLRAKLNGPSEIGYELPKLGTFVLKHNKYASFHEYLLKAIEDGTYKLGENYEESMYKYNIRLMEIINQFRSEKAEKRRLRDARKTS